MAEILRAEVRVPYAHALCTVRDHRHQRCALHRTPFGPGKYAVLHRLEGERADRVTIEHALLGADLYRGGQAFLSDAAASGWESVGPLFAQGPYAALAAEHSGFRGPEVQGVTDPDRAADLIVKAAGFVTDEVTYRLYGFFQGGDSSPMGSEGDTEDASLSSRGSAPLC